MSTSGETQCAENGIASLVNDVDETTLELVFVAVAVAFIIDHVDFHGRGGDFERAVEGEFLLGFCEPSTILRGVRSSNQE